MLTPFDDYPIHQTPLPVAHPATGDPNHYDRYWFNAYREDFAIGVALGRYPNRGVIDGAVSVVAAGVQRSVFVSGRAPADPARTDIGPLRLDVVEPLRVTRVVLDAPEHGIAADMTFTARTEPFEEPRQTLRAGTRLVMDVTRFTQWGRWTGFVDIPEGRLDLSDGGETLGTKDRSWGVRPVGPRPAAAPSGRRPGGLFLWAPLHFPDVCVHYMVFEDPNGERWFEAGAFVPPVDANGARAVPVPERLAGGNHHLRWAAGVLRAEHATLTLRRRAGTEERIELEPVLTFRMRGLGYAHPRWAHGVWHDELVVAAEEHKVSDLDVPEPSCIHVQQIVRARWGERRGLGTLEHRVT